jgi:beta-phosphoglucomutase-like phosphatase (HAD superfamily)
MTVKKAVLWDMDGTLIDSEPTALQALARAIAEVGLPPIPDLPDRAMGKAADAIHQWLAQDHGLTEPPCDWERRKHRHHLAAIGDLRAFREAFRVFRTLEAAGIPQAVVSNSDRLIMDAQLRRIGAARPGLITVARNDVRKGKPDPEGYLRAAWLLGADPAECLVIEDSPSGIAAGRAAGMTTLAVPHAPVRAGADATLARMDDILAMVAPG